MQNNLRLEKISKKTAFLNRFRNLFLNPNLEPLLVKLAAGGDLGAWTTKLLPNHYQYPKPSPRKVTRHGIQFSLDISDLVDWAVYFDLHENSQKALVDLANPGDVVIDVGANIGSTLLRLAQKVGPGGKVYGFEPDPTSHENCRRNIALNSFKNITLHQLALGTEKATLSLFRVSPGNPGMNKILDKPTDETAVQVAVVTLDDFVKEQGITQLNLMKIDVEGFEWKVIEGGKETIQKFKPILFVEVTDEFLKGSGSSAQQLLDRIRSWGYSIRHAENGTEILAHENLQGCQFDVICRIEN